LIKQGLDINQKNVKSFIKISFLPHKNIVLLSLHVFTMEEKGMAYLHAILGKIAAILK